MKVTMTWKVYHLPYEGAEELYLDDCHYDFSNREEGVRILDIEKADRCDEGLSTIIRITRDSEIECCSEFMGQLTDGAFENSRVIRFEELKISKCTKKQLS